jgi:hypothetical protein
MTNGREKAPDPLHGMTGPVSRQDMRVSTIATPYDQRYRFRTRDMPTTPAATGFR